MRRAMMLAGKTGAPPPPAQATASMVAAAGVQAGNPSTGAAVVGISNIATSFGSFTGTLAGRTFAGMFSRDASAYMQVTVYGTSAVFGGTLYVWDEMGVLLPSFPTPAPANWFGNPIGSFYSKSFALPDKFVVGGTYYLALL